MAIFMLQISVPLTKESIALHLLLHHNHVGDQMIISCVVGSSLTIVIRPTVLVGWLVVAVVLWLDDFLPSFRSSKLRCCFNGSPAAATASETHGFVFAPLFHSCWLAGCMKPICPIVGSISTCYIGSSLSIVPVADDKIVVIGCWFKKCIDRYTIAIWWSFSFPYRSW